MAKTTIQISTETKDLLTSQGKMGETYDRLIERLLRELEELRKRKEET